MRRTAGRPLCPDPPVWQPRAVGAGGAGGGAEAVPAPLLGYAVFGRWQRREMLANADDVAAGHVTRFRRADAADIVRSHRPAHPAIVSVETFTRSQLLRRSRAAGGLPARRRLEHGLHPAKHAYVLRGLIRCGYCSRRMEGTPKHGREYYRCVTRTLAPGSPALATHPRTVHLAERAVLPTLNSWLGELFAPDHLDGTVDALLASRGGVTDAESTDNENVRRRLADVQKRLDRLTAAIEAGADPAALIEPLNAAQAQRIAAQNEMDAAPPAPTLLTRAQIQAIVDSLGDVGASLSRANPERLQGIYRSLRVEMVYDHESRAVDVKIRPLGGLVNVSEGGLAH